MWGMSLNKLMEELSIQTLSGFDAETRFRARAAQADPQRALQFWTGLTKKRPLLKKATACWFANVQGNGACPTSMSPKSCGMQMIALDTNILARFYVDDPNDPEAIKQRPIARRILTESPRLFVPLTVVYL